jgi:hypothetical protein
MHLETEEELTGDLPKGGSSPVDLKNTLKRKS